MSEQKIPIPARVYNAAVGGHVCGLEDVDFGQKVVHLIKYDRDGNEVSFESQVTQANKIYVIHDDFILSSNVNIPANCVLEFDGGSLSGAYTITFNNTLIKAGAIKIFDSSLFFDGRLADERGHIRWFGASPDKADNTVEVQKVIDCFNVVFVDRYIYKISGVNLTKAHTIVGIEEQFVNESGFIFTDNITGNPTLITPIFNSDNPYLLFKNIAFYGHITNNSYQPNTIGIDTSNAMSIRVYNCTFENIEIPLVSNYNSYYNYIEKCRFVNFKWGLYRFHANNLNIICNKFDAFEKAIYKTIGNGPINVRNNSFEEFTGAVFENDHYNSEFNLNFEENYIESYRCDTILKGWVGNVTSIGNLIQILGTEADTSMGETVGSIDCIYNVKDCKSLISINNTINFRRITINQYVKSSYTSGSYRTFYLVILKDMYDDDGNVDLTSYNNFDISERCKPDAVLEGYDFISKRIYSILKVDSISPVKNEGYWYSESDRRYAIWHVKNNVIYFWGTLKKDATTVTEGKTHIADLSSELTTKYLSHNSNPDYPRTDEVYIKAMDSSYDQVILLLHISTGVIDFIKGDTTKDIIFDGCCVPITT